MSKETEMQKTTELTEAELDKAAGAGTHYAFVRFEANGTVVARDEELEGQKEGTRR